MDKILLINCPNCGYVSEKTAQGICSHCGEVLVQKTPTKFQEWWRGFRFRLTYPLGCLSWGVWPTLTGLLLSFVPIPWWKVTLALWGIVALGASLLSLESSLKKRNDRHRILDCFSLVYGMTLILGAASVCTAEGTLVQWIRTLLWR
jgi:rRNA maturation protein Nop10